MRFYRFIACSTAASLLTGCANGPGPFGIGALFNDRTLAAAEPLFGQDLDRCLDDPAFLLQVFREKPEVDDAALNHSLLRQDKRARALDRARRCYEEARRLNKALGLQGTAHNGFSRTVTTTKVVDPISKDAKGRVRSSETVTEATQVTIASDGEQPLQYTKLERNEIIDALIAASDRKCGRYTEYLKTYDGSVNTGFAMASIVTAGLGGIVGGVKTAKALSGSSAILNGSRAALNEIHFANQTIQVLSQAYGKEREMQRRELSNREACPVVHYSLMRGFQDAIAYHNACSITTGLQATAAAVQRADNPGVDTLRRSLAELSALRRAAGYFANPDEPIALSSKSPTLNELIAAKTEADDAARAVAPFKTAYDNALKTSATEIKTVTDADPNAADAIKVVTDAQAALVADAKGKLDKAQLTATAASDKAQNVLTKLAQEPAKLRNAAEDASTQSKGQYASCPFTAHDDDEGEKPPTPAAATTGAAAAPVKETKAK